MNQSFKSLVVLGLAAYAGAAIACDSNSCCTASCNNCDNGTYGMTYFHAREASQNLPLRMMGVADKMHLFDKECEFYGVFSVALGYERSFKGSKIGKYFGFDGTCSTLFSQDTTATTPNGIAPDTNSDARAIDWGLGTSSRTTLSFSPRIDKVLIDLDLFLGLDEFINGLWMRVSAPLVWARYNLNPCEVVTTSDSTAYGPFFVNDTDAEVAVPYTTVVDAWKAFGAYGDVHAATKGKIRCGSDSKFRLGSLDLQFGYDMIRNECAHLGIFIHGVAATGNKADATYLFEPIAGTYNWQLGGGLGGSWTMWNKNDEQKLTLYGEWLMTHMFKRSQERLLGLTLNGTTAGNSWILLKKFSAAHAYDGEIDRATDMLARCIKVGNNFMTDFALMLQYQRCAFDFSIGYNFWYRSKDKTSCSNNSCGTSSCCSANNNCSTTATFAADTYGIKGVNSAAGARSVFFYSKTNSDISTSGSVVVADATEGQTTATAADYVLETDVTSCVALAPSAYSNKIFGYIGHNWLDCDHAPYLGLGGMFEWARQNRAATQFGVYLKGGISF